MLELLKVWFVEMRRSQVMAGIPGSVTWAGPSLISQLGAPLRRYSSEEMKL